jgi:hypothetical protein
MTACSNSNDTSSYDLASRDIDSSGSNSYLAYCNQGSAANYTVKLQAYVASSTNQINYNYAVMRLSSVPSTFTGGTSHFALWKWYADSSNAVTFNQTALQFYVYDTSTGDAITGWINTLKWSDISAKYASSGLTVANFLARLNIIVYLDDPNAQYDVLELASYTTSTGALIGQLDMLLPVFAANPNDYATEANGSARAARLKALHPFASQASAGLTSAQFQTMSQNYCF